MKKNVDSQATVAASLLACLVLVGCELPGSTTTGTGSTPTTGTGSTTPTATVDPVLTSLVGVYQTPCTATAAINGATASTHASLSIYSDSTFAYINSYYSSSNCTGLSIWLHTPGTLTVGSATSSPANGHLLRFTHGSAVAIYTTSANGAAQLNSQCGWGGTFSSNGGLQPMGDWNCVGDARFTLKGPNTIVDLAVVLSGLTLSTTAMSLNMPGVLNGVTVASSTSLTFAKQ